MSVAFDLPRDKHMPRGWTLAEDNYLRVAWLAGKSSDLIAAEISAISGNPVTHGSVCKRAHRLNLPTRATQWTHEATEDLREMYLKGGKSASVIASELNAKYRINLTRNAVIGKINRLDLPRRSSTVKFHGRKWDGTPRSPNRGNIKRANRLRRAIGLTLLRVVDEFEFPPAISDQNIPKEQRKSFLDLGKRDCRWPVGEVGSPEFFFCGGVVKEDHSYCAGHCAVAYRGR